jgi:hypothetical protein
LERGDAFGADTVAAPDEGVCRPWAAADDGPVSTPATTARVTKHRVIELPPGFAIA